jgi:Protein of unknown function (DUF402)
VPVDLHPTPRGWAEGETILRREVLNDGRCWLEIPVRVVVDEPGLLATYIAEGAPFAFPEGDWPTPDGRHPWHDRGAWQGHGVLMLQRPGEAHAIWHFWAGAERRFAGWYVNFQEPFRRRPDGYDTQDLELDIWIPADGPWEWKDRDAVQHRVEEGRLTPAQADAVRAEGARVAADLHAGSRWWDPAWASWRPDPPLRAA